HRDRAARRDGWNRRYLWWASRAAWPRSKAERRKVALPGWDATHILASPVRRFGHGDRLSSRSARLSEPQCSLRLEAQDVALSRLKHGFESRRERHSSAPGARAPGVFVWTAQGPFA